MLLYNVCSNIYLESEEVHSVWAEIQTRGILIMKDC